MSTPNEPRLRIADISEAPESDAVPESEAVLESEETAAASECAPQPARPHRKRSRKGDVRRMNSEEIEIEIERVNRMNGNGRPTIYRGDETDSQDSA